MKTKLQTTKIFLIVLSLFILGCRLLSEGIATPADADLLQTDQESQVIVTPEETHTATPLPSRSSPYTPFGLLMNTDFVPFPNNRDFGLGSSGSEGGGNIGLEVGLSGAVCSLEQPFTLTDADGDFGVLQFTPTGPGAGTVSISGGWILEREFGVDITIGDDITIEGAYTVENNQNNSNILEGNLGLHVITSPACFEDMRLPNMGCFPLDSWIFLTPLETTECAQP